MRSIRFVLEFTLLILLSTTYIGRGLTSQQAEHLQDTTQRSISLKDAITVLEKTYQVHIVYEETLVAGKILSIQFKITKNLDDDLGRILSGYFLTYEKVGAKTIVINSQKGNRKGEIVGKIINENGEKIPSAQVIIKGTTQGAFADLKGEYVIRNITPGRYTLITRVVGYCQQSVSVQIRANETINQDFLLIQDVIQMDEVVITATRNPLSRRESSVAITSKTWRQIAEISPRNTTDLLRVIPGFYVESSGGEVGGNLFTRGLPADGSYYYVAAMEDGMPVFDAPALSFVNADIFVRLDENIERIEAVRGGNSALFGSNAPGGVINFISKTGGDKLLSISKITVGTSGLARYDFNINGPAGNNLKFNVGGFYRRDKGIRDPGFPASNGGQFKGNLSYLFKNGYIKFYGKYLNDSNIFYLPLPFKSGKSIKFVDGFPHDGTLTTAEARLIRVPTPTNQNLTISLKDGQKQVGGCLMVDFNLELFGGWSLRNTTRYMKVNHSWNALLPVNLVNADDYARSHLTNTPGAANYNIVYTNHFDADQKKASFNTANGLLCESGIWYVSKPLENISNQFLFNKTTHIGTTEHNFSAGSYLGYYSVSDFWYWQNILTDVRSAPRLVDVRINDADGKVIRQVTENGFRKYGSMYMNTKGFVTLTSFFLGDNIKVNNNFLLDIGARFERNRIHQKSEDSKLYDLAGPTDADDAVMWGDGVYKLSDVSYTDWAASLGVNYTIKNNLSIYARGGRSYKIPTIDVFRRADGSFKPDAEELTQGETGIKMGTSTYGVNATAYLMQLKNFPSQDARVVNKETVWVTDYVGKSQSYGLEFEAVVIPIKNFKLNITLTLQDHEYKKFVANEENFAGNWIQRIPKYFSEIMASYYWGKFNLRANYHYNGKRFANNANTIELPGFGVVNLSASYIFKLSKNQNITIDATLMNLLNGNGLTEGNPRLDNSEISNDTYYLARPILPRRLQASVVYEF